MKKRVHNSVILISLTSIVFIVIVAIIYSSSNRYMLKAARESAIDSMNRSLESKAHVIEEYFDHEEDTLRQYSMLPDIRLLLMAEGNKTAQASVQRYTEALYATLSKWEGLYVADTTTTVLAHSDPSKIGMVIRAPESAAELIAAMDKFEGLYNIGIIPSPASGLLLMSMYSPVYNGDKIIGYVGGGPYAEDLKDLLDRIHPDEKETSNFYIINLEKEIYIYDKDINRMGATVEDPILLDAIARIAVNEDALTSDYTYLYDDTSYIVVYYNMPYYNWAVIAVDNEEEVYKLANANSKLILRVGSIALVVFLLITTILSRFLGKEKNARQKADSENQKKSAFLANMSHEIRTPMNAVSGMADILLNTELTDEQRKYVSSIKYAGSSLVSLVNDILDYSKIDSGNMSLIPVEYSTQKLFNNVAMIIQNRITSSDVALIKDIDLKMPRTLYGDDIRIKQILINLLNNAVKFTEKGYVKLSAKIIEVEDAVATIEYRISDTGSGIRPEDIQKLFSSFSQVDTTRNREKEGTGLGLAICKMLAKLMDGEITVESEYGKGSTFIVTIKQKIIDATPMEPLTLYVDHDEDNDIPFSIPDIEILVVDDNKTNLTVARGLLKLLNPKTIDTGISGKDAIAKASEKKYDIIFMDHLMPEMDGVETVAKIRELPNFDGYYKDATIVALTANAMNEAKLIFKSVGVEQFITKPIDNKELRNAIHKILPKDKIKE